MASFEAVRWGIDIPRRGVEMHPNKEASRYSTASGEASFCSRMCKSSNWLSPPADTVTRMQRRNRHLLLNFYQNRPTLCFPECQLHFNSVTLRTLKKQLLKTA
jgi:hypothetical protein